ncbi:MAG: O-antigen ligase family protein [Bacteroidales bacterium]|nr:O-antigen ligase family protein [Bacteroidales bacterium]
MILRSFTSLKNSFSNERSLSELGLWLLIPLASLTSHTWLPIPPTMVLLLGAIVCWFVQQFNSSTIQQSDTSSNHRQVIAVYCVFIFYIFVSQYLLNAVFRHYMGAIFAPLYLILILIFSERTSTNVVKKLGQKFIRYSLIILTIEAILRYSVNLYYITLNPDFFYGFYSFKFNGPMYLTSNAVACHLVTLLFFMFWWRQTYKESLNKEIAIAFILIALTFSRAAIPAIGAGLVYYGLFRDLNWKKSVLALFSIGIIGIISLFVLRYFISDDSFQSKFIIIEEAFEYYKTADLKSILFGIGFYETEKIMTYYAHNYFLLYLMETGVIGLFLLCATLFTLVLTTNGLAMIILIPFIIQSAAESQTFLPYFYVTMAFIIVIEHRRLQLSIPLQK